MAVVGRKPGTPKTGGRKKGTPNKTTTQLKEAILAAAEGAGNKVGDNGLVSYLEWLAEDNNGAFSTLLGKVLPMQVDASVDGELKITIRDMTRDA